MSTISSDPCRCIQCGAYEVCSTDAFRAQLERERDRADRSQRPFSLVVLEDDSKPASSRRSDWMAPLVQSRLRLADLAGWLSQREIGIILFDTTHEGARIFLQHLLEHWPPGRPQPLHRIYTYPSSPFLEDERQLWFDALKPVQDNPILYECFTRRHWTHRPRGHHTRLAAPMGAPEAPQTAEEALHYVLAVHPPHWNRLLDVLSSGLALLLLSPLLLLISLGIRLCSPGPALFRQERVGFMGRTFHCLKFRTMHLDAGTHLHRDYVQNLIRSGKAMHKLDGRQDPRVYTFGRLLRATSLDELPQLINVLRGDMSLIGPRPCIPYEYERFQPWHRHRVDTLPGLTGLWQVSGKNKTTFAQMIRLDRTYARKKSFWLDTRIVLSTIPVMLGQFVDDLMARKPHVHLGLKTRWANALAFSRQLSRQQPAEEAQP